MRIEPFGVEIWMNDWETRCRYNLAETCVESLTVDDLLGIAGLRGGLEELLAPMKLTYGAIPGSDRLRNAIADRYDSRSAADVIVTHGAIGANALVHQALLSAGDHVVSVVPAYQQHTAIPESLGADVTRVALSEADGFALDYDRLAAAVTDDTVLICLTNPNNPTGSLVDEAGLRRIAEIAEQVGAYVLCDEVYRGTDDAGSGTTASIADVYPGGISTSSMSKAFSLAGLRLGWICGPPEVISAVAIHRDYHTISVGMIDDALATVALEHADVILDRTRRISREHRRIVDDWVRAEPRIDWVTPRSGTTGLLRYDSDRPSRELCVDLVRSRGVLLTPGSAMEMEGRLRIGYAGNREELITGLAELSDFLRDG